MKVELKDGDFYAIDPSGESDDDGRPMMAACIFDGHHGQYIYGEIVELAVAHGFKVDEQGKRDLTAARSESAFGEVAATEEVIGVSDEAENYLNDQIVTEGWSFGWHDGEYFLANQAWWECEA